MLEKLISINSFRELKILLNRFSSKEFGLPILIRYYEPCTHRRDPATAPRGRFELLDFSPGPLHVALDNLDTHGFPPGTHIDEELSADASSTCHSA